MNYKDLFLLIKQKENWETTGQDVQYSIDVDKNTRTAYLLFQETRSRFDWCVNLDFPARLYKKYYIHRGYADVWESAKAVVEKFVKICSEYRCKPVISGWSYGGAMALLAAEEFHYLTEIKPTVITYGAPKILYGRKTRDMFRNVGDFTQYARINDLVTYMIPFPFVHHVERITPKEKFSFKLLIHPEKVHPFYEEVL